MKAHARIAMVSEHASPLALLGGEDAGGQNVYLDAISRSLAALGYSVDIFTRRDSEAHPAVVAWRPGVRVIPIQAGPPTMIPKDAIWPLMPELTRGILRFMLRSGARYDLLHGHFWMSGWAVARLRRLLGLPAVQIFHASGVVKRRLQGAADTSSAERIEVERALIGAVDRVIVQCPAEHAELVEEYGAAPQQLCIIPPGADTHRFRPVDRAAARAAIGAPDDGVPTAVYVGRMLPRKDVRNLLYAARLLRDRGRPLRVLLVGGESAPGVRDPELEALDALAYELGVADHVIAYGRRQPDELRNYYGAADMVVSTPWYEPFGLTALEAMACGRPAVVSAVGGLTFSVQDGETGLHVPPRDPGALAAALAFLANQPELAEAMGRASRARVEREFTWPLTARRTAALYAALWADREGQATGDLARAAGESTL
jgi:D-inositol-3-phosphate glycosyltransferase